MARDFRISESCLQRWSRVADREDGPSRPSRGDLSSGAAMNESAELQGLKGARIHHGTRKVTRRAIPGGVDDRQLPII